MRMGSRIKRLCRVLGTVASTASTGWKRSIKTSRPYMASLGEDTVALLGRQFDIVDAKAESSLHDPDGLRWHGEHQMASKAAIFPPNCNGLKSSDSRIVTRQSLSA